jgi:ubiquitin-conjugating enzyme E2 variant
VALFATNGFHCWAHTPVPPRWVGWLQRHRLVLAPQAHAAHHRGAHDQSYCVTTGWLNLLLDRWRFFERVEVALARIGISTRRDAAPRVSRRAGAGAR